jgi:hypothetical protein
MDVMRDPKKLIARRGPKDWELRDKHRILWATIPSWLDFDSGEFAIELAHAWGAHDDLVRACVEVAEWLNPGGHCKLKATERKLYWLVRAALRKARVTV